MQKFAADSQLANSQWTETAVWSCVVPGGLGVEGNAPVSGCTFQMCSACLWTTSSTFLDLVLDFVRCTERTISLQNRALKQTGIFFCTNRQNPSCVKTMTGDFSECKCCQLCLDLWCLGNPRGVRYVRHR